MDLDHFSDYFKTAERQRKLKIATFIMFLLLAVEKQLSCVGAAVIEGKPQIISEITFPDVVSINIYIATAVLIAARVRYDRLVIPDFFLLGLKLCIIAEKSVFLITERDAAFLDKFSAVEYIIEAALFAAFLICMFTGELSHGKRMKNFSSVCMNLLMICLPVTVLLEVAKMIIAVADGQSRMLSGFNFVWGVLNETFLDVPYFLLILMVCLTNCRGYKITEE